MSKLLRIEQHAPLLIFVVVLVIMPTAAHVHAQEFFIYSPIGKITLKDGSVIKGKNLDTSGNIVTLEVNGIKQSFELANIEQIMTKKGKAKTYAGNTAMCCLFPDLYLILLVAEEKGTEDYTFAVFFAGIFYGIGYAVGAATDPWVVVFGN